MKSTNPTTFLTQCNLSSVLYTICIQHYESLQKADKSLPNLPHFVSESIHEVTKNISKIVNDSFTEEEYWKNIQEVSSMVNQTLEIYNNQKSTGESNEQS